jgi:hypothetical protein
MQQLQRKLKVQQALQQNDGVLQGAARTTSYEKSYGKSQKKVNGGIHTLEEEENPNVNSEIENNEFVQTPDGEALLRS